jgi:hypothetical protein
MGASTSPLPFRSTAEINVDVAGEVNGASRRRRRRPGWPILRLRMASPTVEITLDGDDAETARLVGELRRGGVFVTGCALAMLAECTLVLRRGGAELAIPARAVWIDGVRGAGLELTGFGAVRDQVAALLARPADAADADVGDAATDADADAGHDTDADADADADPDDADPADATDPAGAPARRALHLHERLRNLSLPEQLKVAAGGQAHARIVLERMYGKTVWDAVLRNPRVTTPEVTRIARMGALPRPLVELIVGNGTWLQIPEVRRALLGNPRLTADQIPRVLRMLPRHELKLVPTQTAYPAGVRDVARRMLRDT